MDLMSSVSPDNKGFEKESQKLIFILLREVPYNKYFVVATDTSTNTSR